MFPTTVCKSQGPRVTDDSTTVRHHAKHREVTSTFLRSSRVVGLGGPGPIRRDVYFFVAPVLHVADQVHTVVADITAGTACVITCCDVFLRRTEVPFRSQL